VGATTLARNPIVATMQNANPLTTAVAVLHDEGVQPDVTDQPHVLVVQLAAADQLRVSLIQLGVADPRRVSVVQLDVGNRP
jgi:hypothetical protein